MGELGAVFAGGVAGALARTGLAQAWSTAPGGWPWATLVANVAGAFVLGLVLARTRTGTPLRGLLGPGLCGALTTFSTLQVELVRLLGSGHVVRALAYGAVSLVLGLAALDAGRRRLGGPVEADQ